MPGIETVITDVRDIETEDGPLVRVSINDPEIDTDSFDCVIK